MLGIIKLACAALMTVAATVLIYVLENKWPLFRDLPYAIKQAITGMLFGIMAIFGTEFGIEIDGAMANVRDAAPVCAGLIFGAPAGIIAGLMGGFERWIAVYWGVGMYTRVACTIATIVAGFFAAFVRKFMMNNKKPTWFYALAIALLIEVFHMLMVFLTHLGNYEEAFTIVSGCAPIMITMNSLAVGLAVFVTNRISREPIRLLTEKRSVIQIIEIGLLITVVISFVVTNIFVMVLQNQISHTAAEKSISYTLNDIRKDVYALEKKGRDVDSILTNTLKNRHIGDTGGLLLLDKEFNIVAMTYKDADYSSKYGTTVENVYEADAQEACFENEKLFRENASKDPVKNPVMFECSPMDIPMYAMVLKDGGYYMVGYYPKAEADLQKNTSQMITAFVIILILGALFIQIFFLVRTLVVKNIDRINDKLGRITEGDLDVVMDVRGSEEFSSLSNDINTTVNALKHYIKEAEERIDRELEFAKAIQYSTLNTEFPDSTNFELYANMLAAREVGGDFYDFYRLGDGQCVFMVADVSGKGIPAAMFMMQAKTLINSLIDTGADMATVLTKANEELCQNNEAGMFVTAFIGIMNTKTGEVQFANAGHNKPVVVRNDGTTEYLKCRNGFVLAGIEGVRYTNEELVLNEGDGLFMYTDGVTEATNMKNELYGEDRLLEELSEAAHMSPRNMCVYIKNSIDGFVGEAPQFDDITMLAVHRKVKDDRASELVIIPNDDSVPEVLEYFERRTEELDIPMKIAAKVGVMVDEIYSNIVHYSGATIAKTVCKIEDNRLEILMKDNGVEYNPLEKEDPDIELSAEERDIGGLGIFMVKSMADDIRYKRVDGKNMLKIIINL